MFRVRESRFLVPLALLCALASLCPAVAQASTTVVLGNIPLEKSSHPGGEYESPAGECSWEAFFASHRRTVTREDFFRCLYDLVPEKNMPEGFVVDRGSFAEIAHPSGKTHRLLFAPSRSLALAGGRYWRHPSEVEPASHSLPLSGARIALDPGHIGGEWAEREGRLFHGKCGTRIAEGDMNLIVANLLKAMLENAGARVWLTRSKPHPANGEDPSIFAARAERELRNEGKPVTKASIQSESDRILLQAAEIESRSKIVNERIRPDLVVCLHFNAEPWGTRGSPRYSERNHLHVLVGGSHLPEELDRAENRLDLVRRAAEGTHMVELPLARSVASRLARETGLPPFSYGDNSRVAEPDSESPFVWKRNLLATRIFHCPVVYPEPFVMNNHDFIAAIAESPEQPWLKASSRRDIFAQYAGGVYEGIVEYWSSRVSQYPVGDFSGSPSAHPQNPYAPRWLEQAESPRTVFPE